MERILLVFKNAFRGILFARSMYLWIIAVLIVGLQLTPQIIFRDAPPNLSGMPIGRRPLPQGMTDEQKQQFEELQKKENDRRAEAFREQFRRNRPVAFAGGLNTWSTLAIFFGILLGANVLASEVSAKTIITVLARPIARWELLLGKWLAIQLFGVMSLAVGMGIHFAVGRYLGIDFNSLVWLALLHAMVSIMLYSAAALALATIGGWMVAAGVSFVLYFIPNFVTFLKEATVQWQHLIGVGLNWIVPPGYKSVFINSVDATAALDRSALSTNLVLNLLYCAIFFAIACVIFSRREVRLG